VAAMTANGFAGAFHPGRAAAALERAAAALERAAAALERAVDGLEGQGR
jgi:hypothetical protein